MNIGQLLLIFIGCHASRFYNYSPIWGIGILGVEPETPRPPIPHAPPIHPCPYQRDGLDHPSY
jgi:hypothetical protein